MLTVTRKHNCCGCGACVQVCPCHCIVFVEDEEGFRYPVVSESECLNCGLCDKVCQVLHPFDVRAPQASYAARHTDDNIRLQSSSGGVFTALAESIIKKGGVVFGARFDDKWRVVHGFTEEKNGIEAFRGSKYVQSSIGNSYVDTKRFLDSGRLVLFSGTPCQIAGLKQFLLRDYVNLLTVDVVCHGVPSPKVWTKYFDEVRKNVCMPNEQVSAVSFRDKCMGWKRYSFILRVKLQNDSAPEKTALSQFHRENPFMRVFLNNTSIRPSCYYCPAKGGRSQSDMTMADFWGIERILPVLDDDLGISLLLINSSRGASFLNQVKDIHVSSVSFDEAVSGNPCYARSVSSHGKRSTFFKEMDSCASMTHLMEWLSRPSMEDVLCRFFSCMKRGLLEILRKS